MVEEENTFGKENTYAMPKKEQMYSTKKAGGENTESKGYYSDIFNVNQPKAFTYKPE